MLGAFLSGLKAPPGSGTNRSNRAKAASAAPHDTTALRASPPCGHRGVAVSEPNTCPAERAATLRAINVARVPGASSEIKGKEKTKLNSRARNRINRPTTRLSKRRAVGRQRIVYFLIALTVTSATKAHAFRPSSGLIHLLSWYHVHHSQWTHAHTQSASITFKQVNACDVIVNLDRLEPSRGTGSSTNTASIAAIFIN